MAFVVRNSVALVTGSNRGIGKAIVAGLCSAGIQNVYAGVRTLSSADPLVAEFGSRVIPIQVDLDNPATVTAAASQASNVNLVINNAGILRTAGPLAPHAEADLRAELETNTFGLLRMAQAFGPVLKANGGGAFVQLNSVVSMKCFSDFATYCASKAAAYSLTQALRDAWQSQGTLVVSVHPGPINTDMAHSAGLDGMAEPPHLVSEAILAALAAGQFHAYPDTMAKNIGAAYQHFATNIVEANLMGG
jgi:NAD(P)-dependent dehydrogenase (short-subunit alcohol dehydrogenase family)